MLLPYQEPISKIMKRYDDLVGRRVVIRCNFGRKSKFRKIFNKQATKDVR